MWSSKSLWKLHFIPKLCIDFKTFLHQDKMYLLLSLYSKKFILKIYLLEMKSGRVGREWEREGGRRDGASICWFTTQTLAIAAAEPGPTGNQELHLGDMSHHLLHSLGALLESCFGSWEGETWTGIPKWFARTPKSGLAHCTTTPIPFHKLFESPSF